jgi:hypothetical protein
LVGAFAFRDIGDYAHVLEIAGATPPGMRNHVNILNDTVGQEYSMLDIQVHAVLRRAIPQLLQMVSFVGMNSLEC